MLASESHKLSELSELERKAAISQVVSAVKTLATQLDKQAR